MKIQPSAYVSVEYTLTDKAGEVLDRSRPGEPLGFVFGAGMLIPGFEKQLEGLEAGDHRTIVVPAKDGYGEVRKELFREVPREQFPTDVDIEPGMQFGTQTPQGFMPVKVAEVRDDVVVVDLNHPLAGTDLHFDVTIDHVRESTPEDFMPASCCDSASGCSGCSGC